MLEMKFADDCYLSFLTDRHQLFLACAAGFITDSICVTIAQLQREELIVFERLDALGYHFNLTDKGKDVAALCRDFKEIAA